MRLKLFPKNKMEVVRSVSEGDTVVFEQNWSAEIGVDGGGYKKGDEIRMKIVTIFKMRNGLVIEHTDYPLLMRS